MFSERKAVSCHEKTDCINKWPTRMILVHTNESCCAPAKMRKMSRVYAAGIHTVYVYVEGFAYMRYGPKPHELARMCVLHVCKLNYINYNFISRQY